MGMILPMKSMYAHKRLWLHCKTLSFLSIRFRWHITTWRRLTGIAHIFTYQSRSSPCPIFNQDGTIPSPFKQSPKGSNPWKDHYSNPHVRKVYSWFHLQGDSQKLNLRILRCLKIPNLRRRNYYFFAKLKGWTKLLQTQEIYFVLPLGEILAYKQRRFLA